MENATKALYIAAGTLVGVMILSLAVMLFSSLQSYVEEYKEQIEVNNLNAFNSKYQKYINTDGVITIQDIVTIAGSAYEDNSSFNVDPNAWNDISKNSLYVGVYLKDKRIDQTIKTNMQELLEKNTNKKYQCKTSDVKYNSVGRIYEIRFSEK